MTVPSVAAALCVGAVLLASAGWLATRRPRPLAAAAVLVAAGVAWAPANKPIEGPTLLTLRPDDGLTVADLLLPAAVLVAVALRAARRRKAPAPPPAGPPAVPPIPRQRGEARPAVRHRVERRSRPRERSRR